MTRGRARLTVTLVVATVAAMLLHGCASSPPTQYVTLSSVPAEAPPTARPMQAMKPVQLTALHIPQELDRPELATQPAPNRIEISETERWAAPLAPLMRLTLARDLETRLPDGAFVFPDSPAPKDARSLVVTVIDLDLPATGELTLHAAWTLVSRNPEHVEFTQRATLRAPIQDADAAAKAAALSHALGDLADRIAASIVQLPGK